MWYLGKFWVPATCAMRLLGIVEVVRPEIVFGYHIERGHSRVSTLGWT
jgi:hypothetical protein